MSLSVFCFGFVVCCCRRSKGGGWPIGALVAFDSAVPGRGRKMHGLPITPPASQHCSMLCELPQFLRCLVQIKHKIYLKQPRGSTQRASSKCQHCLSSFLGTNTLTSTLCQALHQGEEKEHRPLFWLLHLCLLVQGLTNNRNPVSTGEVKTGSLSSHFTLFIVWKQNLINHPRINQGKRDHSKYL